MVLYTTLCCASLAYKPPLVVCHSHLRFGSRHTAMNAAYDAGLRGHAHSVAERLGMKEFVQEGVYAYLSGPSYETPAESHFLSMIGADLVGMSTAPEVIVARQCGMRVLGEEGL